MEQGGYAQSLKVNFIRMSESSITINVRGIDKDLAATEEQIEQVNQLHLLEGQSVQLWYTDKTNWRIRLLNLDVTEERRYFRKDDQ